MVYHLCNILTCGGMDTSLLGGCGLAWLTFVFIFFLAAFGRKYLGEDAGVPFSFLGALIGGFGADIITITFTCSYKFGLAAGIGGIVLLGIVFSSVFEGLIGGN